MINDNYSAGLISQSFWFIEFKKIVFLLSQGKTEADIKILCLEQNLLGAAKEERARRMYGYLINRAKTLDDKLIDLFTVSDLATQKLINLVAILRLDRLLFEFVYEVYRDKAKFGIREIGTNDVNIFFNNKEIQSSAVAIWKDTTLKKLGNCYLNFMTDANLIAVVSKKRTVTPPIVDASLERYLTATGEISILKAISGVE